MLDNYAVPGASIAVQTYGDFLNFNPHLHAIVSDSCFLKDGSVQAAPTIMPNEMSSKEARQNWARLIQKIYEVDPLVCPKCQCQMKIISIIDDFETSQSLGYP